MLADLVGLKTISRCGTGVENIDLDAANELGIKVTNTPTGPILAVAELAVGLMFNLLRNISVADREVRKGVWKKRMGNLIKGKNVGIIGFGRIGQKIAELLVPFGANIAYFDINKNLCAPSYTSKELSDLCRWANIISINADPKDTIIGEKEIKLIKRGGWIINTSRGKSVDEHALYKALKSGHLAGAALDVFEKEPYFGSLKELDNVIFTPHIGSYAKESRIEMEIQASRNLLNALNSDKK